MIKQNNFHMEVYNIHFSRNLRKYELFLKYLFTVELVLTWIYNSLNTFLLFLILSGTLKTMRKAILPIQ